MTKSLLTKLALLFCFLFITITESYAQKSVFSENFDSSQTNISTISGIIPGSLWNVTRSGSDYGARIHDGKLNITNDASPAASTNGWVLASTSTANFDADYKSTLNQNAGIVSWTFNMRQSFPNPSGFGSGKYGVAYILAGTENTTNAIGQGYAIQVGRNSGNDPISLVRYDGGMNSIYTILSSESKGPKNVGTQYMSIRVEYNPADEKWKLFVREDGGAFADPKLGTLLLKEEGMHVNSFTNIPLTMTGGFWNAGNTSNDAFIDNVGVSVVVPEIISLTPSSKIAGSGNFTLVVNGKNFREGCKILWNGQERTTIIVSDTKLSTNVQAADIITSGVANITVKRGTTISNSASFTIQPSGAPILMLPSTTLDFMQASQGFSSDSQFYTISANNLNGGATVTAPANFEISTSQSTGFTQIINLPNTGGGLTGSPVNIYARLKGTNTGVFSGNISHTSAGATPKYVAVSGRVMALEPTTSVSNINFTNITSTAFKVDWTSGSGENRLVIVKKATAVSAFPADGITYDADATFQSGSNLGDGNFVVYKDNGNSAVVTGLLPDTNYHVSVIEFNGPNGAENYFGTLAPGNTRTLKNPAGLQLFAANTSYKINFDQTVDGINAGTFQGSGITPDPEMGQLDSNAWAFTGFAAGDLGFDESNVENSSYEMGISNGHVQATGIYGFNVGSSVENYALGIQPGVNSATPLANDFNPGTITLKIQNQTGAIMTSVNVGYKVYIYNDQDASSRIRFSYSSTETGTFMDQPIVDVVSPTTANLASGWKAYYRVVTIPTGNIANNDYYYIRWNGSSVSGTGAQDEFAIDDIEVIANPTSAFASFDGIAEDFVLQGNASLSAALSVQNSIVFNGGKLAIKDKTLTIAGSVINTTANGLTGGATSKLVVRGTKNPTLSFDQSTIGTTNAFDSFSLIGANVNIVTALNDFSVNGNLNVDEQQILNLGTNVLSGNLASILNHGQIQTQNTSAIPFASGKNWNGTGILNINAISAAQTLVAGTYTNLTLSSTSGTTAAANVTVNGILDLPFANASTTKGSLSMAAFTLTMGPDGINTGIGDVTGIIKRDFFTTNKLYTFGHPNSSITFAPGGTLPASMSAKLTIGVAPTWKAGTILRQFDIIQTGANGTKAIIRQHYLDSELNGNAEAKLVFWANKIGAEIPIFEQGRSNNNSTENWVEITNADIGLYFVNNFGNVFISLDETADPFVTTWTGKTSTSWTTVSNWSNGKPSANSKVIIPAIIAPDHNPTLNIIEEIGSLAIEAGGIVNSDGNEQLFINGGAGAWQNNGMLNAGSSTVTFRNLEATISGSTAFNNLNIANGGGLRALEGNYISIAGTLTNNGIMFTILTTNTIEFKGINQTIPAPGGETFGGYHHLIISGNGASIASTTLNVRGNLTLDKAVNFAGKTINLAGISNQTIGGLATAIDFNNLIVNKETGRVVLAKAVTVGGTLFLTKGNLVIGSNNLTLGQNPVAGTFNVNNMIVADGTGLVRRPFASTGNYLYPIGELTGAPSYSPITVNVTAGSFSNAFVGVNVSNLKHPNNNSSQNYLKKYWNVTQTGISGAVATITGKFDALDILGAESEIAAAQLNGTFNLTINPWTKFGLMSNNTIVATDAILTAGQTSAFTGLKAGGFSLEVYGYGDFCIASEEVLINAVLTGGDAPFTYNWSNGLPDAAEVAIPTSEVSSIQYTLTVTDANGFSATDTNIPVEIFPTSVGGTVSQFSQTICAGTAPADLQLAGSTGKVLYWQKSTDINFGANSENNPNNVTNLSVFETTISGAQIGFLSETTYFRAVLQNGDCPEVFSDIATITIKSTTWNGNNWSDGLPTPTTSAIFTGAFTATASIEACTIAVTNGAVVTIPATFDVTLYGALTVESGSTFTLASNTNLIQLTDVENSGAINVERESSKLFKLDYTMWGSPVIGEQTLKNFSPATVSTRFYTYNSSTDQFNVIVPETSVFDQGKGYLIRMPNDHTPFDSPNGAQSWTGTFTGTPTNGDIAVTLDAAGSGYNMLANPYASMIDANQFLADNAAEIDGTLYFWRRRNAVPDASAYYATYTFAGGTSVPNATQSASSTTPNGFIQVGQGFIAKKIAGTSGNAVFTNSMRTNTNDANQFFRTANSQERSRIWLNVTNTAGEFGQTLVAYMPQAENGVDRTDGKYLGDGSTALTSWLDNSEYIIQGRAPFTSSDVVALNFKTLTAGTYTIATDHVDGLFAGNQDIFLRDNSTGILHDLKSSAYTFATEAGSFNSRFDIVYLNPLSVSNPNFDSNSVILYKKENIVVINSGNVTLDFVEVYDIRGRLLATAKKINSNEVSINIGETNQVLIVNITSIDGIKVTKKTIN